MAICPSNMLGGIGKRFEAKFEEMWTELYVTSIAISVNTSRPYVVLGIGKILKGTMDEIKKNAPALSSNSKFQLRGKLSKEPRDTDSSIATCSNA